MVVVDSGVWIDFFNGAVSPARSALRTLLANGDIEICVPDLVLFEVLRGFRQERDFRSARALMRSFAVPAIGGEALAIAAAEHYRALRFEGVTVRSAIDVLIAAYCIEHGHHLLHSDRDYQPFEERRGLRVWRQ